jgi:hypothetical protein
VAARFPLTRSGQAFDRALRTVEEYHAKVEVYPLESREGRVGKPVGGVVPPSGYDGMAKKSRRGTQKALPATGF